MNMKAAASRLGLQLAVLKRAKNADCPAFKESGVVDAAELKQWIADHPEVKTGDPHAAELMRIRIEREKDRARQERVAADTAEGKTIDKTLVRQLITRCILHMKTPLLAMPQKLSQRLSIMTDVIEIEQLLMAEARAIISDTQFDYGFLPCPACGAKVI